MPLKKLLHRSEKKRKTQKKLLRREGVQLDYPLVRRVDGLVERFDIEPFSDFSAK